jgi:bifunctional non-homologous end joining protein LigD
MPIREPSGEEGRTLGRGLTTERRSNAGGLKPELVGQLEFVEWTEVNHLRHTKFVGLRDDKKTKMRDGKHEHSDRE